LPPRRDAAHKGPFRLDEALRYAERICDALDAAHQKGIVHRDPKAGNILLSNHGIKLLDFGVARMQADPEDSNAEQSESAPMRGRYSFVPPRTV
jgi:serine/threonine-protein kinase